MFSGSNVAVTGGKFVHNEFRFETAFEKLQRESASSAFHDSSARFDPPQCHPNTRVAILDYLMGWIFGKNDPEALILWLYGPAGAGKSAILQTIAERCFERKALLASFFFGRLDPTRNHFKPLVATIAYQIAIAIPDIKPILESIIDRDPLIFDKSIAAQVQSLIVEPLKDLAASGFFNDPNTFARLILIDGLDECSNPRMHDLILMAFAKALRSQKLPLIFLIASRPEQRITLTFNSPSLSGLWRSLVLDNKFRPDIDIRLFLKDSFQEIKASHPHCSFIPESWPEQSDVDKLVEKSSGQFIYASVVVKYVSGHDGRPHHRMEVVKGLRPARRDVPFAELDALYLHILGSSIDPETVLLILGLITSRITSIVYYMEVLLDLQPGDVEIALVPLNSLLKIKAHRHFKFINLFHASLDDFLFDISRSGLFYINTLTVKENTLAICTTKLMHLPSITLDNMPSQHPMSVAFLTSLASSIRSALLNLPLTETVRNALQMFSLPKMWTAWLPECDVVPTLNVLCYRGGVVSACLDVLHSLVRADKKVGAARSSTSDVIEGLSNGTTSGASCVTDSRSTSFSKLYSYHLYSFEPVFKSETVKYYKDIGLMSLVVLTMLPINLQQENHAQAEFEETIKILFRLTEESIKFDADNLQLVAMGWGRELLISHYRYLFIGSKASAEASLDETKYTQTALRTLEFLCAYPPHPIQYQTRRKNHHPHPSRTAKTKRWTDSRFLRKRREEKHRHGVTLSLPETEGSIVRCSNGKSVNVTPCRYGLMILPALLDSSSKSSKLVDFILANGKKIAYLPELTREAIPSMHQYLDRVDEGMAMVDLRKKFAAMVIE